jgi:hypothetical protein
MILTSHAIVGAALASAVPTHPVLAFSFGFCSHFVLDAIPHWDYHLSSMSEDKADPLASDMKIGKSFFFDLIKIGSDCSLGFLLAFLFFGLHSTFSYNTTLFFGALGAVTPDALQFLYFKWRREPLLVLQKFHGWIHSKIELKNKPFYGISSQIFFIAFVVALQHIFIK